MKNTRCHNGSIGDILDNNITMLTNCNNNGNNFSSTEGDFTTESFLIIQSVTACVGIIGNSTVILVFVNHRKFRIPNIFIINQVNFHFRFHNCFVWYVTLYYICGTFLRRIQVFVGIITCS